MDARFVGDVLMRRAGLTPDRLEPLYATQREKGMPLVDLVVSSNLLDEGTVANALALEAELPFDKSIDIEKIQTAVAVKVPISFARQNRLIVVSEDEFVVHAAVADPFHVGPLDDMRVLFGKPVEPRVAAWGQIENAINRVYERGAGGAELASDDGGSVDDDGASDILDSDDEAPVIRWVNSLFLSAMKERASDIHIEPEEKEVIVRYRIDGELYIARRAPKAFMNSIVSRVKIESALNIAEKRLPQDGRISKKIAGKGFDIRVSTIPTSRGYERIVMRLLNKSNVLLDLPDLGFSF
jgi:general secretion pathway protein E